MKPGRDDLVRVRSEGELRPGMTVWLRDCRICGRDHAEILLRASALASWGAFCQRCLSGACRHWEVADEPHPKEIAEGFNGYCTAIAEGRLFRLRDDQQPTTSERQREREDA